VHRVKVTSMHQVITASVGSYHGGNPRSLICHIRYDTSEAVSGTTQDGLSNITNITIDTVACLHPRSRIDASAKAMTIRNCLSPKQMCAIDRLCK